MRESDTAFPCASAAILPKTDAFACGAAASSPAESRELDDAFNYANFDSGARVLQAHKSTKGARNVLNWDPDTYMSTKCKVRKKWLVFELSEMIRIKKIHIANLEQYSATFAKIQVMTNNEYPEGEWMLRGSFIAKDNHQGQDFHFKEPYPWGRIVKIRFLTHHGDEHYCTVSRVKVFGTSMLQDIKKEMEDEAQAAPKELPVEMSNSVQLPMASEDASRVSLLVPKRRLVPVPAITWPQWNQSRFDASRPQAQQFRQLAVGATSSHVGNPKRECYYGHGDDHDQKIASMFDPTHSDQSSADCDEELSFEEFEAFEYAQAVEDQHRREYEIEMLAIAREQALQQAQMLADKAASRSAVDENPFRAITNKIRVVPFPCASTAVLRSLRPRISLLTIRHIV